MNRQQKTYCSSLPAPPWRWSRTSLVLLFFTFFLFSSAPLLTLTLPLPVRAQAKEAPGVPEPRIPLRDFAPQRSFEIKQDPQTGRKYIDIPWLAQYIRAVYLFALSAIGILAVTMIMIGGVFWMTAGGNTERVTKAKEYIGGAIMGVVLALFSFTLLNTINPDLVALKPLRVPIVEKIALVGQFCDAETEQTTQLQSGEQLVFREAFRNTFDATGKKTGFDPISDPKTTTGWRTESNQSDLECGKPYFYAVQQPSDVYVDDKFTKGNTCIGRGGCKPAELCVLVDPENKKFKCERSIFRISRVSEEDNRPVDYLAPAFLFGICGEATSTGQIINATAIRIGRAEYGNQGADAINIFYSPIPYTRYHGSPPDALRIDKENLCVGERGRALGLLIGALEIYDDDSWGVDADDWFYLGKKTCANGPALLDKREDGHAPSLQSIKEVASKIGLLPINADDCSIRINSDNFVSD